MKELIKWANSQDVLLSLLYDLDLMPEQITDKHGTGMAQMLTVIAHFKGVIDKHTAALVAKDSEIERLKHDKNHEEWMAGQLCAVENALGCSNDYDPKTGLVDTHSKVLERIRDLVAAEGEVGDLRAERDQLKALLVEISSWVKEEVEMCDTMCVEANPHFRSFLSRPDVAALLKR